MEENLIAALLADQGDAWEQFVDGYGPLVRRRVADVADLFGKASDWSTIDDVTAEVFASLLSRDAAVLRCFKGQSRLSTYLAVIATRVARRALAKIVRQTESQCEQLHELQPTQANVSPDSLLIGREELDRLLTLVDRLPRRQRELVVAFYREEQSYAEISHRFDIPIGSIGTTLRRAEQKLRQWIDDETK